MAKQKKTTKNMNKNKKINQTSKEVLNRNSGNTDLKKGITCVVVVLVIFGLMYLITLLILKNASTDYIVKENEKTTIQHSEILAGTSFDKKDDEYLVLFYDMNEDEDKYTYANMISEYKAKEEHLPFYYVDLSNKMNKSIISEEVNKNAKSAEELKVNGETLIKFNKDGIVEYIEGEESISNYLK